MEDTLVMDEACFDLAMLLQQYGLDFKVVDRVVGPAMGAITVAHEISRHIGFSRARACLRAYTEKETGGEGKLMVFKKTAIHSGERILPVEDVLTTGGSVNLTTTAVTLAGGIVLPFVAVLVNRSGLKEVSGKQIVALIDQPMPIWTPQECPLCKEGSEAIRPKGTENWARLNASY
jgi:orotate phosphoribosyltransferase